MQMILHRWLGEKDEHTAIQSNKSQTQADSKNQYESIWINNHHHQMKSYEIIISLYNNSRNSEHVHQYLLASAHWRFETFFSGRAQYKIATDIRPPGTYDMPINCPSMGLAYCMGLTFGWLTWAKVVYFGVMVFPSSLMNAPLFPIWSQ